MYRYAIREDVDNKLLKFAVVLAFVAARGVPSGPPCVTLSLMDYLLVHTRAKYFCDASLVAFILSARDAFG